MKHKTPVPQRIFCPFAIAILNTMRFCAAIFMLWIALILPSGANAQSTNYSAAAPWVLYWVQDGCYLSECQFAVDLDRALTGHYYPSPAAASAAVASAVNGAVWQVFPIPQDNGLDYIGEVLFSYITSYNEGCECNIGLFGDPPEEAALVDGLFN